MGAGAGISLDTRDSQKAPTTGVTLNLDGTVFPEAGDVESTFGELHGDVSFYQSNPILNTPTLALRAGGKHVWGEFPYYEAAYIGGAGTLRGFPRQRFAGDASLFGNAELRLPLRRVYVFVPGTFGVFGLIDTGRVFFDGETSHKWHVGAGGGLWIAFLNPNNTVSVSVASGDEGTRVYLASGLAF
jgi:outer membrane protein assembly factor BamA